MPQLSANRFHPKRWTILTWLAVLMWILQPWMGNYPPFEIRRWDSATGEFSEPIRYKTLQDIPFAVGWPLRYVIPNDPPVLLPVTTGATPLVPPPPSKVSLLAMFANVVLVLMAIAALVYLLQTFLYQFSLLTLFAGMSAVALFYASGKLVVMRAGYRAAESYFIVVYFSPIVVALAARWQPAALRGCGNRAQLLVRRFISRCKAADPSSTDFDNPDDALAAAARLDMRGEWNASIDLYRRVAARWPEHAEYVGRCVDRIAEKQSLGQTQTPRRDHAVDPQGTG